MWGRVVEVMLGLWLLFSPFIFGHYPGNRPLWISDLVSGIVVMLLALLSFWHFLRYAHLAVLVVAGWLVGFGYLYGGHPAAPGFQNNILCGLTLMIFAIIPNEASQPPRGWRSYYHQRARSRSSASHHM